MVKQDYRRLLKPEIINSIKGLSLISRLVVDGHLAGSNRSLRLGSGMEFSQYRAYEVGDDLRLLDWKMLARSGRYYIKQSEIETHVSVKFVIDASNSMRHQEDSLTKMDYVKVLTASLAWLAQRQGDAIGLFSLNNHQFHSLRPKSQKKHFNQFLQQLISINPDGKFPHQFTSTEEIHNGKQKEMIFFITDLHEETSELTNIITSLKSPKNEVVVLQVMGKNEMEFNYKGALRFKDLETGATLEIDAEKAREEYLVSMQDSITETKDLLLVNGISYNLLKLDEPLGEFLQLLLKIRQKLM